MARIMVVNHDLELLQLMQEILASEDHEPVILRYGEDTFSQLREAQPDLIILDIRIDRQADGWTLCDKLTLHEETAKIPVLVCSTAIHDLQERRDWLEKKGIGVLPKPFDLDDLLSCVSGMLKSGAPCMVGLDRAS